MKTAYTVMVFVIVMALFTVPALAATIPTTGANAVLRASLSKYEPLPAQPGNYVDVWIKIENIGNNDAKNAVIEIVPEFPFIIDNATRSQTIGILGGQKDYIVDFKVRVADDAISGMNTLKVRFTDDPSFNIWSETDLPIKVESVSSDINIASYVTAPSALQPGQTGKLRIKIDNVAGKTLRDIKMTLNLVDVQGTTVITYPFIPIGTTAQQWIDKLDAGQSTEFIYDIQPYPDAESKSYKIPITLNYKDNQGNEFTKHDLVGIIVNSQPELMVNVENVQIDGKVSIKIVNKGLSTLKFLTVTLKPSKDYDIVSQKQSDYIGKLESDDFETVDFQVAFKDGNTKMPITITFRDANNNAYEQNYTLDAKVIQQEKKNGTTGTIIIVVVVLLIIGFIVYRVRKKKKP